MFLVSSCGFQVIIACSSDALVWVSGGQRVHFLCSRVDFGCPSGAFHVLACKLRVISGCAFDALVWVSRDLRVCFWCSRVGFG